MGYFSFGLFPGSSAYDCGCEANIKELTLRCKRNTRSGDNEKSAQPILLLRTTNLIRLPRRTDPLL